MNTKKLAEKVEAGAITLGTWSMAEADPLVKKCPVCWAEHDVAKMSPEQTTMLMQFGMIADIAMRLFEFIGEVAESRIPMMTQLALLKRESDEGSFDIDLWAGVGETMITRLQAKNAEIESLVTRLREAEARVERLTEALQLIRRDFDDPGLVRNISRQALEDAK